MIPLLLIFYCFSWPFCYNFYSFQFYHSNQVHDFYFFDNNNNNNSNGNSNNSDDNINNNDNDDDDDANKK